MSNFNKISWNLFARKCTSYDWSNGPIRLQYMPTLWSRFSSIQYSIYPFHICSCSGFVLQNTVRHSKIFLIFLKKCKKYSTELKGAPLKYSTYVRTKFERARKRQYCTQQLSDKLQLEKTKNRNKFGTD